MQVRCIRARMGIKVGEVVEVPDGSAVSELYFEPVTSPPPPPPAAAAAAAPPRPATEATP